MERIVKYSRPTHYDKAAYGTIWEAQLETTVENYIQLNSETDSPAQWSKLGEFLEKNYRPEHLKEYLKIS